MDTFVPLPDDDNVGLGVGYLLYDAETVALRLYMRVRGHQRR